MLFREPIILLILALVITPYCYIYYSILCCLHYQDPSTIEHETAASGDTYAVVDKPKRSSKKKRGPDMVPPPSEGVSGAVLSSMQLL